MTEFSELTLPVLQRMLYAIITQKQREKFEEKLELDFAYAVPGSGALPRQHVPAAGRRSAAAFRLIPFEIKKLEELGHSAGRRELRDAAAWFRARHRADRFGQVDDAGLASSTWPTAPGATTS